MASQASERPGPWTRLSIGGVLLLAVCAAAAAAPAVPSFDGRAWTVGNQQQNARQRLTEYVLPGQTVENWKELVTSTVFAQPVPIAPFVEKIHASMANGCPSLVWNVVQQDEKTAIFEWRDSGCGGFEAQNELDRVAIERDGLYRLAYAIKVKGPLAPEKRKQWLAILGQAPLAERGGEGPAATPAPPANGPSTEQLAAAARRAGWPCPAGVKSELQGSPGAFTQWGLECSDGKRFSVLVDRSGAMTVFQINH